MPFDKLSAKVMTNVKYHPNFVCQIKAVQNKAMECMCVA